MPLDVGKHGVAYAIQVTPIEGPLFGSEHLFRDFVKRNPNWCHRTLSVPHSATLDSIFECIVRQAFKFSIDHNYEFQFDGKRPNDPNAKIFVSESRLKASLKQKAKTPLTGVAGYTKIGSLGLQKGDVFGMRYGNIPGDQWFFQCSVMSVAARSRGKPSECPKILHAQSIGAVPPQELDFQKEARLARAAEKTKQGHSTVATKKSTGKKSTTVMRKVKKARKANPVKSVKKTRQSTRKGVAK